MTAPGNSRREPFDTEKPPSRVVVVSIRAGSGAVPEVRALFAGNPGAAEPFRDWLASGDAWTAFGAWYDSGNFRKYEQPGPVGRIVQRITDDSPCPVTGRVTAQVDEDLVEVAWADEQYSDTPRTSTEFIDELTTYRRH